jgi:hypothetical protein
LPHHPEIGASENGSLKSHAQIFKGTTSDESILNTVNARYSLWQSRKQGNDSYVLVFQESNTLSNLTLDDDIMIFVSSDGPTALHRRVQEGNRNNCRDSALELQHARWISLRPSLRQLSRCHIDPTVPKQIYLQPARLSKSPDIGARIQQMAGAVEAPCELS